MEWIGLVSALWQNGSRRRTQTLTAWSAVICCAWTSMAFGQMPSEIAAAATLQRFEFSQPHMGTTFKLVFYAVDERTANLAAAAAFSRVAALNRVLSDYQADSELSLLSDTAGVQQLVPVSEDLWRVLEASRSIWKLSDGAFDITVGPVVKLWRRARRNGELPAPNALSAAREAVGFEHVRMDAGARAVELKKHGMRLDVGGIAKGYAADEALQALRRLGISQALVAASGDIAVSEAPPGAAGWRIAIAPLDGSISPVAAQEQSERRQGQKADSKPIILTLVNCAISTSGDRFQFIEIGGRRYSHIVDPRTGLGLTTHSSVVVIADRGLMADGFASAASVLGPTAGLELLNSQGLAGQIESETNGRVQRYVSDAMRKLLSPVEHLP